MPIVSRSEITLCFPPYEDYSVCVVPSRFFRCLFYHISGFRWHMASKFISQSTVSPKQISVTVTIKEFATVQEKFQEVSDQAGYAPWRAAAPRIGTIHGVEESCVRRRGHRSDLLSSTESHASCGNCTQTLLNCLRVIRPVTNSIGANTYDIGTVYVVRNSGFSEST
jgi:hypothetical protein